MSFEDDKANLWLKSSLRAVKDEKFIDDQKKIARGIENIPVNKMIKQALRIENELMPRIEQKQGNKSVDYIFFRELFQSLLWAISMADRNDRLQMRIGKAEMLKTYYEDYANKLESSLNKYATLEDFFFSSGMDSIAEGIKRRADDLLNKK